MLCTDRVIQMRPRRMNLSPRETLERCRTIGEDPVHPQTRMPALCGAPPERKGRGASGYHHRFGEAGDIIQELYCHACVPHLQPDFCISRDEFSPERLVAAQRMRDSRVSDTGEHETRGRTYRHGGSGNCLKRRGLVLEPEQLLHLAAERPGETECHQG